jgi:hypothetical protein
VEEQQRLDQLQAVHTAAEAASDERAAAIESLNEKIEALQKAEVRQSKEIQEAEARLREAEARFREAEVQAAQQADEEARLKAEEETRQAAEAQSRQREFQESLARAKAEGRRVAHEEAQRAAELEVVRRQAAAKSAQRHEREQQLLQEIEALGKLEAEQLARIADAQSALLAREEARQAAEAQAERLAHEEQMRLAEFEDMRNDADAQLQAKVVAATGLKAEVETLRKAESRKLKEIEKLAARRDQHEAEAREREQQETQLLAELEALGARVESNEQDWPEKELSLKAQIEALRKAEAVQLKRIEKAVARLSAKPKAGLRKAAKASASTAKSVRAATKSGDSPEMPDRTALLEAIRGKAELELQQWSRKEQKLQVELQAMHQAEVDQLRRIEETKLRLHSQKEKLQARANEQASLLAEADSVEFVSAETTNADAGSADILSAVSPEQPGYEEPHVEAESLRPLETWQFAVVDDADLADAESPAAELSTEVRAIELSTAAFAESEVQVEQSDDFGQPADDEPVLEIELSEFELHSELSQLATEASSFLAQDGEENSGNESEQFELNSDDWTASPLVESFATSQPSPAELGDAATMDHVASSEKSVDLLQTDKDDRNNKGIQAAGEAQPHSRLVADLTSGDASRHAAALHELALLDENEAFGLITGMFDDASPEMRNAAARALYEFKADRAASFTRALREGAPLRRRHIAAALSGSGLAADAIDNLVGEGREKTYDAFSLLFLMAKAGEVQTLLQTIEKHPDVAVRLSVIRLLTFSNQPDIIPAFRSLAVRGSLPTEVRSAVMEAIYQISSNARENSLSAA